LTNPSFPLGITCYAPGNNAGGVVVKRVFHPERSKNILLDKIRISLTRRLLDHSAQKYISGIVVSPFLARRKIHRLVFEKRYQLVDRHVLAP
jgi:hypothetical protein